MRITLSAGSRILSQAVQQQVTTQSLRFETLCRLEHTADRDSIISADDDRSQEFVRRRLPREPPSGRRFRTRRSSESPLFLSGWWTRTCLLKSAFRSCNTTRRAICHSLRIRALSPLQIVRPRILVPLIIAEWAFISRRFMNKTVSDHFVLALKALSTDTSSASLHGAEMGPFL